MRQNIQSLADIISTHDLTQIERQLRITAVSLRKANSIESRNTLENDKKLFLLAHAFLTKKGKPSNNWRTSTACFENLTDWFEQETTVENHLQLSMASWSCHLGHLLPNTIINPHFLITLGSAYYAEPHKFMGFLYWLSENKVPSTSIIRSTILHCFFAYHAFEMIVIEKSYALLANLSDNLNHFLSFLQDKTCGMRGFINNLNEDQTYYSYNLLGKFFTHKIASSTQDRKDTSTLFFESICVNHAESLFLLFGWELIKKLNYSHQNNLELLKKLLQSQTKTKMLSELSAHALDGQLSTELTNTMLTIIRTTYRKEELLAIIDSEPFYLHAAKIDSYTFISEPHLKNIINVLCTNTKYHTLNHLPFLAALTSKLTQTTGLFDNHWNTPETKLILKTIVDIILPHGNMIHDNAIQPIHYIFHKLKPFFLEKISELTRNIETAIQDLNYNEIDYETVAHLWGSQLSTSNLIFSLLPNLSAETSYPRTIYELHALALQKKCSLCIATDKPFPLNKMLSWMTEDAATQKRILQETLINPASQAELIEVILTYETPQFSSDTILFQPFGNTRSVVFHAFTTESKMLQAVLSRRSDIDDHIFEIIKITISEGLTDKFKLAWSHIKFDETNTIKIFQYLLSCFDEDHITTNIRNIYFAKIFFLLGKLDDIKLPEGTLTFLLNKVIKYEKTNHLNALCNLNGINKLTRNEINSALFDIAIQWESWKTIAYLCGLSGDDINTSLITIGDIPLYLNTINKYKEHYQTRKAPKEALEYKNNHNESLLHLAANHCTFSQFKAIFDEIRNTFKERPGKIYTLLNIRTTSNQIAACLTNHPDKDEINTLLDEACNEYEQYETDDVSTINDDEEEIEEEDIITPGGRNRFLFTPLRRSRTG